LSSSAIPSSQKRTILTQECLRILRNTKIELGKDVRNRYLTEFMIKLKNSGYTVQYRKQILDSALKAFEKMIDDDRAGIKPLFRYPSWNKEKRKKEKEVKVRNWYKSGNKIEYKSLLFVPVTKGSTLAKELQKCEEEINIFSKDRIKIVEDGGVKLKDMLVKKDPFPTPKCGKKCLVCDSEVKENMNLPCNSNNVGYKLKCDTCTIKGKTMVYEGETSRSARIRGREHLTDLEKKRKHSVLFKHKEIEHKGEEMKISMEISKKFKDPLTRQANEAVRINGRNKIELMNSKTEFNHPPIARVTVEGRKYSQKNINQSQLKHHSKSTLKCPNSEQSSLSGTEEPFNHRSEIKSRQKHISSDQENKLESTMLNL
jgi:hypothetical protein